VCPPALAVLPSLGVNSVGHGLGGLAKVRNPADGHGADECDGADPIGMGEHISGGHGAEVGPAEESDPLEAECGAKMLEIGHIGIDAEPAVGRDGVRAAAPTRIVADDSDAAHPGGEVRQGPAGQGDDQSPGTGTANLVVQAEAVCRQDKPGGAGGVDPGRSWGLHEAQEVAVEAGERGGELVISDREIGWTTVAEKNGLLGGGVYDEQADQDGALGRRMGDGRSMLEQQAGEAAHEIPVEGGGLRLELGVGVGADVQVEGAEQRALGPVALHQDADDRSDQGSGRHGAPAGVVEQGVGGAAGTTEEGDREGPEQGVLVLEPGVQRSGGEPGAPGDLLDGEARYPALGDDPLDGGEQAVEGGLAAGLAGRAGLVADRSHL